MQIERLVNGATITQDPQDEVTYWHVELAQHEILLAEGLPAESYLDTGNRGAFANGGAFLELHPDFAPKHWAETCVPLVESGPQLAAVKAMLLRRATGVFGYRLTDERGLHLLADGQTVMPHAEEDSVYHFAVPAGASDLRLMSRIWVPSQLCPESSDRRRLGVCVRRLLVDGRDVPLEHPALDAGWHGLEGGPDPWRWTTGAACLPRGAETISVELGGSRLYWAADSVQESLSTARLANVQVA
jgi:hypothetical protein